MAETEPCTFSDISEIKWGRQRRREMKEGRDWNCHLRLFLKEDFSDCKLHLRINSLPAARFPCHKSMLSASSIFFAGMLKDSEDGRIIIHNINHKKMSSVLEYIYFGWCELESVEFACSVLRIAYRYEIDKLSEFCERYLVNQLSLRNVCDILETALYIKSEDLIVTCLELCGDGGFVVLSTKGFMDASPPAVKRILALPALQVANEMAVFKAVWDWGTYSCCKQGKSLIDSNIMEEVSQYFKYIGFEFMSQKELKTLPDCVLEKFRELFPDVKLELPVETDFSDTEKHLKTNFPGWRKKNFLCERFSDCDIFVEVLDSGARFPCHKSVLTASSLTFSSRIAKEKEKTVLTERGISPMEMYTALKFMYYGEIEFESPTFARGLMEVSFRYLIMPLFTRIESYLRMSLDVNNVCYALQITEKYPCNELKKACMNFFSYTLLNDIVTTKAFTELNANLARTVLTIPSERDKDTDFIVFQAVWKWATARCCKEEALLFDEKVWEEMEPLRGCIDFDKIDDEELARIPEDALKKLREGKTKSFDFQNDIAKDPDLNPNRRTEERKINFPMKLYEFTNTFLCRETHKPDLGLKGNIILFSFSVNINVYLALLTLTRAASMVSSSFQSLHIFSGNENSASYCNTEDDNLEMILNHRPLRVDLTFTPKKLVLFRANVVYSVEVNRGEGDCDFIWPHTTLSNDKDEDVMLKCVTKNCYGLLSMSFIPVS